MMTLILHKIQEFNMIDMSGKRVGRWSINSKSESRNGRVFWECVCDCGTIRFVVGKDLRNKKSTSCGCISKEKTIKRSYKHGDSKRGKWNITYKSWASMKERCTNPNSRVYKYYGGAGITFDDRWNDYTLFLEDMGERPSLEYSIDRIDNKLGYTKDNCRWANDTLQRINTSISSRNTSGHVGVTYHKTNKKWHSYIGINGEVINLGFYESKEDAIKARLEGELKYWSNILEV